MPDGTDHDQASYGFADWWHEREERAGMREEFPDAELDEAPEVPAIHILSGRTIADVRTNQPEQAIRGGLAVRKITTGVSGGGGLGKTTLAAQALIEGSLELPVWGVEEFRPVRSLRALYVNGEDSLPTINYVLGRLLPAYGLDHVPFDEFIIAENGGRFVLTPSNALALAERINAESYDLVKFDPAISFLPTGIKFIDPGAIRAFLNDGLGVLQRETNAALWLSHHDNKAGQALSGPADWGNFCRLALHLERGDTDGQLTLTTVKTNLGYRFKKITLERDPDTGRATAVNVERFGDRSKQSPDADDIIGTLAKIVRMEILPLPSEQRTKWAVIETLQRKIKDAKLKISRDAIRGFASSHLRCEERPMAHGKSAKIVIGVVEETAP